MAREAADTPTPVVERAPLARLPRASRAPLARWCSSFMTILRTVTPPVVAVARVPTTDAAHEPRRGGSEHRGE